MGGGAGSSWAAELGSISLPSGARPGLGDRCGGGAGGGAGRGAGRGWRRAGRCPGSRPVRVLGAVRSVVLLKRTVWTALGRGGAARLPGTQGRGGGRGQQAGVYGGVWVCVAV